MHRREFLTRTGTWVGLAALGARAWGAEPPAAGGEPVVPPVPYEGPATFARVKASADRVIKTTVCLRPFRGEGPRIEAERIGTKWVVHNYGHGGSGWSLSWGSGALAVDLATASGQRDYAVVGCGAIGLTTALLLQRAGRRVTIYAKERPPEVRSSFATGVWSPDSRICLQAHATPAFARTWEGMCRTSHRAFQNLLGLPDSPVAWFDRYALSDLDAEARKKKAEADEGPVKFGKFPKQVKDLTPAAVDFIPGTHPFPTIYARRSTSMVYNLTAYSRLLMSDFLAEGGRVERREFHRAADFESLPEKVVINATGYGAKALLDDASLVPVRGQLALLIPQPEVTYGLSCEGASMVPRADGLVVQATQKTDYNNPNEFVLQRETEDAVRALARICERLPAAAA